jgi:hypothetical protein
MSRQLLEKIDRIVDSDEDDDVEWDEDLLRPSAPPSASSSGGGPASMGIGMAGGLTAEMMPPLARPPQNSVRPKTSSHGNSDDDLEESDLPNYKRMVAFLSPLSPLSFD